MDTFGLAFALVGVMLIRQVVVGRVHETPADFRDMTVALLNGDTAAVKDVLAARGSNVADGSSLDMSAEVASSNGDPSVTVSGGSPSGQKYAARVIELGNAAKGYVLGAAGPTYYDCSGLLWRAAYDLKLYKGGRFTTSTFTRIASSWCTKVTTPAVGDIILWPGHHMGVMIGNDSMYSARSPSKGIGKSTVSGDADYFGSQPEYWRING